MRVRIKAPVYIELGPRTNKLKIPAGSIGIVNEIATTPENTPVATVIFPQGIVYLNPSIYEIIHEEDFPTNPGTPGSIRLLDEGED